MITNRRCRFESTQLDCLSCPPQFKLHKTSDPEGTLLVKSLHVQLSIRYDESWSKMLETESKESDAVAYDSEGSISNQAEFFSDDD